MLLLFMICGRTSLLLFILSYDDNEYKTMKVSKSNWFEKLFYQEIFQPQHKTSVGILILIF